MSAVINDLSPVRQSIDEIDGHIVFFNGLDNPRYYNIANGTAGRLGFSDWYEYQYKAVGGVPAATGTLDDGSFYSIMLVPVNGDIIAGGFPILGNDCPPSQPVQTTAAGQKIPFTVPVHPQKRTNLSSQTTAIGAGIVTDASQSWAVDQWAGFIVENMESGEVDTVVSNTATALTLTGSTAFADEDRYQIQSSEATARYVYASEGATAADAVVGTFYFVGVIDDNTTTTYDLDAYAPNEAFVGDMYAPPNAFTCHSAGDVLYAGGGIEISGVGTVEYNGTVEQKTAGVGTETAVDVVDDAYDGALTAQIARYTPDTAFADLYVGSYVTITSSTSSGNDTDSARVLRVASDKTWFEIENNTAVADAADATMVIDMTPNVIEGTGTNFSEGMVDATFEFTDESTLSYRIAWVDSINQIMGLNPEYTGNISGATAEYRIKSSYDLYYSDFKNPHRYRSTSIVEIGDEIKGLYALGRYMIIFCSGSVWRHSMLEPGSSPQLITDNVYFDATWSICSNGSMVLFYDGEGISATDGLTVRSVSALRGRDYLQNVNKELAVQIQGVYNPVERRFEFSMPMGTDTQNNYGLYITEDSYSNVPVSRSDANILFSGYENGRFKIYHGTSGELQDGEGTVWKHDGVTDGLVDEAFDTTITDITGQVVTVEGAEDVSWSAGDIVTLYPSGNGQYRQAIIESIVDNGGSEYELTFADDYDLTLFAVDDKCLFGMIPFDYGIKWMDFGSPQYLKRVKEIQVDMYGMTGNLYIDHYLDLNESAIQNEVQAAVPDDSKLVFKFRMGKAYIYGFRVRGYSSTAFKINSLDYIFSVIT